MANNGDSNNALVVGGGIAGILSALLLREKGKNVYLVEREPKLGGLLSSELSPQGDSFDYGTHYLVNTGHEKIDALLFPAEWRQNWLPLPYLKAGNFFHGSLNENCMFADTGLLPADICKRGVKELLSIKTEAVAAANLQEYLDGTFGRTFTEHLFKPLVLARLGMPLAELHKMSNALLGLTRILIPGAEETRKLKSGSPVYDKTIGFHSYREGTRPTMSYYPTAGGTSIWINFLERRLTDAGVHILKNKSIQSIRHQAGKITAVAFADGDSLACSSLFWTLPVSAFLKCAGMPTVIEPPKIRVTSHFHYVVDRPASTGLYYFLCNDASKLCFRVTLYSNVQTEQAAKSGRYCLSVEVLSGPLADIEAASKQIFRELIEMRAIPENAQILWQSARSGVSGIPVITPKFVDQTQQQLRELEQRLSNAYFAGMVPGHTFFKKDVLVQSFDQVARLS